MGHLSDEQFAGAVNSGGASRMLHTNEAVTPGPQNAGVFGVSLQGHEKKYADPVVRQQVRAHADRLLADPTLRSDPDAMQGGWKDDGTHFLDASRKVKGRHAAVAEGQRNSQIAVFDYGSGKSVYTTRENAKAGPYDRLRGSSARGFTKSRTVIGARAVVDGTTRRRR